MKADAQALKGHLDTLLPASLENGPRHGNAVKDALTPAGCQWLSRDRAAWRDYAAATSAILEPAP